MRTSIISARRLQPPAWEKPVLGRRHTIRTVLMTVTAVVVASCTSGPRTVASPEVPRYDGPGVSKVLVIGVADNYESRTRFERKLASDLRYAGTTATAYYVLTAGDKPIIREEIERAAAGEGFDAVLISRVTNRDSDAQIKSGPAGAKATRREADKPLDLFRYDYEELNEPDMLDVNVNITIRSELFALPAGDKLWSVETSLKDVKTLSEIIEATSSAVVKRLQSDGLLRN